MQMSRMFHSHPRISADLIRAVPLLLVSCGIEAELRRKQPRTSAELIRKSFL